MSLTSEVLVALYGLIICCILIFKCLFEAVVNYFRPHYKDMSSDIVLITGAGNGIGQMLCLKLAPYCSKIVIVDINLAGLNQTEKLYEKLEIKHKARLFTYTCDLRMIDDCDKLVKNINQDVGIVTVCINNAGIVNGKYFLDLNYEEVLNVIKVNLLAHFYLIQKFLPNMLGEAYSRYEKNLKNLSRNSNKLHNSKMYLDSSCATRPPRGHIVCINSVAGTVPAPGLSDYCASKAAAILLVESLREEIHAAGLSNDIKVTNINPYYVNTGMFHGATNKFTNLMPIQSVESATNQIVEAIRREKNDVYVSPRFAILPFIKHLFPYQALNYAYKMCDVHKMMTGFSGKSSTFLENKKLN